MTAVRGPIRFACQGCGRCCTGEPGTVYVTPGEAASIADFLRLGLAKLKETHLYPFRDGYSIREDDQGNCLLYNNGCLIYSVRPAQCRCFPFWRKNLATRKFWSEVERECPGIGRGPLHSEETIRRIARSSPL